MRRHRGQTPLQMSSLTEAPDAMSEPNKLSTPRMLQAWEDRCPVQVWWALRHALRHAIRRAGVLDDEAREYVCEWGGWDDDLYGGHDEARTMCCR